MRNRLFLLTAAVVLSACADDQHSTAPASRSGLSGRSASADAAPSGQSTGNPQAKPIDQVGFTTTFGIAGPTKSLSFVGGLTSGLSVAQCPAGSHLVGGGYLIVFGVAIAQSQLDSFATPMAWVVQGRLADNADSGQFSAFAICAQ